VSDLFERFLNFFAFANDVAKKEHPLYRWPFLPLAFFHLLFLWISSFSSISHLSYGCIGTAGGLAGREASGEHWDVNKCGSVSGTYWEWGPAWDGGLLLMK